MKERKHQNKRLEDLIPNSEKRKEVLDRMYKGEPILGKDGIFTDMLQAFVNAALDGEADEHIEQSKKCKISNRRNGYTSKNVRSSAGPLDIKTPRDRDGSYNPILVGKWDRSIDNGIDDIILSLYARGQSVEDVRYQLKELYGIEVSAGLISRVTDRVWEEIVTWQQRNLSACYAIVYLDAVHYRVREDGKISNKAIYSVYGITADGQRDILGLYLNESEGARQWGLILEDLKRRGVADVFFFCIDGLTGFKDAIEEVYPNSQVQRCIVHMVRSSTRFVSYKDIKKVCSDLRRVYTAANREQAEVALKAFGEKWDKRYKEIRPKWEDNWEELMAFMDYSQNIRRMIYTTNPVEALHRIMRKTTKSKGAWSNDKGLLKQLYLALKSNQKSWKKKAFNWTSVQRELIEHFGERYEKHL